jgi:ferredoxin-NADP reductase
MSAPPVKPSSASVHEFTTELVVRRRDTPADGVIALDLADPNDQELPRWGPGAHIDVLLGENLTRQYSLCGDPQDSGTWRIGVLLDPDGRGGSRHIHIELHEGVKVRVRGPRNHFPLVDAEHYRFFAGGIGITPILPMIEAVETAGSDWSLVYLGRQRTTMAFAESLADSYGDRVTLWPRDSKGTFDLETALKDPADDTLIYCCGPERLLAAMEQHTAHWPDGTLYLERFAAKAPTADAEEALEAFEVVCQRSGVTIEVGPDLSILETLEDEGIPIMGSCYEGVCGTCEARVLEGTPVHRDSVLTEAQKAAGEVMMTCVSRSYSERLVLDL